MSPTDEGEMVRRIHADLNDSYDWSSSSTTSAWRSEREAMTRLPTRRSARNASGTRSADAESHGPRVAPALDRYVRAKEVMLERTPIPESRWWVIEADDKKRARLNCFHHLLGQMPHREVEHAPVVLPERIHHDDDVRYPVRLELMVTSIY